MPAHGLVVTITLTPLVANTFKSLKPAGLGLGWRGWEAVSWIWTWDYGVACLGQNTLFPAENCTPLSWWWLGLPGIPLHVLLLTSNLSTACGPQRDQGTQTAGG